MKEEPACRVRAGEVGAPATLGSFAPTNQKSRMMVIYPGLAHILSGSRSGRAAMRREQWEQLESNQCEK
jgi:hypothetical protein